MLTCASTWSDAATAADDRTALRTEWANIIDRFSLVVRAHEMGELAPDIGAELIDVARLLERLSPKLDAMQLRRPAEADLRRLGIQVAA